MKNKITPPVVELDNNIKDKLVSDNTDTNNESLYSGDFVSINNFIENKVGNNETILDLFPDIELSMQILTSAILSPKDLTSTNLIFKSDDTVLSSDVRNTLLNNLKKYVNSEYKLTEKLPTILREALFTKGSFIETYIPEASVDNIINDDTASLENYADDMSNMEKGFFKTENIELELNTLEAIALENFNIDDNIEFSDNLSLLTARKSYREMRSKNIKASLGIGFESHDTYDKTYKGKVDAALTEMFKPVPMHENADVVTIRNNDENERQSTGKPMKMKLPVESVIPVHMPNDPTDHVGYFVLLGDHGEPITKKADWNDSQLDELLAINSKTILDKSKKALKGITEETPVLSNMGELYGNIINKKITAALQNSNIGDLSEVIDTSHIYQIMTSRVLLKQKTRLLYIPEELVSFYAFNYRTNGTGESLLERISMLASIRAMILFARLMAFVKNSINNTKVSSELDPKDPNPKKTMKRVITESMKARQTQLPFGVTKIDDLVDWSQKVGFSFEFKNHPGIPDMTTTVEDVSSDKKEPNTDLDDDIRKHIIMSFGLTPEIVDNGFNSEFASTVIANNALLAKRVMVLQEQFTPMITTNVKKIADADFKLKNELKNLIFENMPVITKGLSRDMKTKLKDMKIEDNYLIEWLLDDFLSNLEVTLPKPDIHETDGLKESYDEYKDAIDDNIENFFGDEALPTEIFGEMTEDLEAFKTAAKSTLLRKWMSDNNYLPDLQNMLVKDKNGEPILNVMEEYQTYIDNLIDSIKPFLKDNVKRKKRADKIKAMIEEKYEGEEEEETDDTGEGTPGEEEGGEELPPEEGDEGGENLDEETGGEEVPTVDDGGGESLGEDNL